MNALMGNTETYGKGSDRHNEIKWNLEKRSWESWESPIWRKSGSISAEGNRICRIIADDYTALSEFSNVHVKKRDLKLRKKIAVK